MAKELARLVLPKPVMRRLETAGVYCQTWVTAEKTGSGGAVGPPRRGERRKHQGGRPLHLVLLTGRQHASLGCRSWTGSARTAFTRLWSRPS